MMWRFPKNKKSGEHNWRLKEAPSAAEMSALSNVPPQIAQLLHQRGVTTQEEVDMYLSEPALDDLPDPFLLTDMDKAIDRLEHARTSGEHVVVFGDNDPDGTSGSVILTTLLQKLNIETSVYLPDRVKEGHAMTNVAVEEIVKRAAGLVITVDTGIREHASIAALLEYGIETIVLDHHIVPDELPASVANVDPRRENEPYGFDGLCGAAVAFVFVQAIMKRPLGALLPDDFLDEMLDVVAIATVADMVPLLGPNRTLLKLGLAALRSTKRLGLLALFEVAKIDAATIDEHTVAFEISPRINAVSRVEHASTAFTLLMAQDEKEALVFAKNMNKLNGRRQRDVRKIVETAKEALAQTGDVPPVVIIRNDKWPPTMIGISASRIREFASRPAFLCAPTPAGIRCSARAHKNFNLVEAMEACGGLDLFDDFGGHPQAAGLTIREDWYDLFVERMTDYAAKQIGASGGKKPLDVDIEIRPHEISPDLMQWLEKLAPFGKDNPRPTMLIRGLEVLESKSAGIRGSGVRMKLVAIEGGQTLKAAAKDAKALPAIRLGDRIDVVAELRIDSFKGRDEIVLVIIDARLAQGKNT